MTCWGNVKGWFSCGKMTSRSFREPRNVTLLLNMRLSTFVCIVMYNLEAINITLSIWRTLAQIVIEAHL